LAPPGERLVANSMMAAFHRWTLGGVDSSKLDLL
jgi:hypothetical protein